MAKLIAKIVVTGGPCAGKTTTITKLEEYLKNKGYHVLILRECATDVLSSGVIPYSEYGIPVYDFQNEVMNLQLYREKRLSDIVEKISDDKKVVMLLDRGIVDNKAYLGEELYNKLISEYNLNQDEILDRYDMVIHMITVANNIKNRYGKNNNTTRFENADEAISLDKRTSDAWNNHKCVKVAPVTELLEEKIKLVTGYVDELLNKLDK